MDKFKVTSFNAEGISAIKTELLSHLDTDILCLQETHKDEAPPTIPGMNLIIHHGSRTHGSAIYAREKATITNSEDLSNSGFELLKVETENLTIPAVYKPPPTPFVWPQVDNKSNKPIIAIGDFNSHNTLWGYSENNPDGESVEDWASSNGLALVHSAKDKPSFASARWKKMI